MGFAGMVSFGHAAYFGIGAYAAAPADQARWRLPLLLALPAAAGRGRAGCALVFGFFCVRLTQHLLRHAHAGLRPDRVAVIASSGTRSPAATTACSSVWPPRAWLAQLAGALLLLHAGHRGALPRGCCAGSSASPFGLMLRGPRERRRAEFIGVNVRALRSWPPSCWPGPSRAGRRHSSRIFNRGVFPDFAYWTKSSEVLIMVLLGGIGSFSGPLSAPPVCKLLDTSDHARTPSTGRSSSALILVVLVLVVPGGHRRACSQAAGACAPGSGPRAGA